MSLFNWENHLWCLKCNYHAPMPFGMKKHVRINRCPICGQPVEGEMWRVARFRKLTFANAISPAFWLVEIKDHKMSRGEKLLLWLVFVLLWVFSPARSTSVMRDLLDEIRDALNK